MRALPLGDTREEGDVLAGQVAEGREFLERAGVALQGVLESTHGQDALRSAIGFGGASKGLPAKKRRPGYERRRVERLGSRPSALVLGLPLRDYVKRFFAESLVAHNFPAGKEDGENFHEDDGKANPVTGSGVAL